MLSWSLAPRTRPLTLSWKGYVDGAPGLAASSAKPVLDPKPDPRLQGRLDNRARTKIQDTPGHPPQGIDRDANQTVRSGQNPTQRLSKHP